jgi:formate dehydrogenase maturation protein FdhE
MTSYSNLLETLSQARQQHPELADVIALHSDLIHAQAHVSVELSDITCPPDKGRAVRALDHGEPLLSWLTWQPDTARVYELWPQVCSIIATHRSDCADTSTRLGRLPAEHVASFARAYLMNVFDDIVDVESDPALSLARVALNHTLRPFLRAESEHWRAILVNAPWRLGTCPFCGGAPDLAALENGNSRRLLCSRCDFEWRFSRVGCPFCGDDANSYFEDAGYCLYVCDKCQHYLKAIDVRQMKQPPILEVERVLTIGMDIAARDRGYVGV